MFIFATNVQQNRKFPFQSLHVHNTKTQIVNKAFFTTRHNNIPSFLFFSNFQWLFQTRRYIQRPILLSVKFKFFKFNLHLKWLWMMSVKCDEESTGNSEQDWEIFDVLCKDVSFLKFFSSSEINFIFLFFWIELNFTTPEPNIFGLLKSLRRMHYMRSMSCKMDIIPVTMLRRFVLFTGKTPYHLCTRNTQMP